MKTWWTGPELAGLPGMPAHRRVVLIWGDTGRLQRRERTLGKGWEYHVDSLPPETRDYLFAQAGETPPDPDHLREVAQMMPVDPSPPTAPAAPEADATPIDMDAPPPAAPRVRQLRAVPTEVEARRVRAEAAARWAALPPDSERRQRAEARHWCLRAVGDLRGSTPALAADGQARPASLTAAARAFSRSVEAGEILIPREIAAYLPRHQGVRGLSHATLLRWFQDYDREGLWGLTAAYGAADRPSRIEATPDLHRALLGAMLRDPQATGRDLHAWLATVPGVECPPLRSVQRYRERWIAENHQLWTLMTHPGRWKNHYQVAFGSQHEAVNRLNQLWEMDSTPGDWLLTDGRHTVVGCIDLWSRRAVLIVSKSSSSWAVGQTFRRAVLAWGVPESVRTDNGKDYVSDYIDQALMDLDVTHELCIPFSSEQKGTIERLMQSVCYGIAKLLPGYIGHNVAERDAIRARKTFAERIMQPGEVVEVAMSSADLQSALDRWLEHDYHQRPHQGDGMRGQSPIVRAASWSGGIRTVDPRALDSLLAPLAGERTIAKKGIRWDHRWYISPALAPYIGDPVLCRYDETDLGRLYVYRSGAFLCIAEDPDMTGISRAEVAAVARAQQKQAVREHAAELRQIRQAVKENAAEAVLRHRAEQAGKLIAFPHTETPHSTPALAASAAAAEARATPADAVPTPAQAAALACIGPDPDQAPAAPTVHRLPDTPMQRYRRWLSIQRDVRQGLPRSRDDLEWWDAYATSSEYRAQARLAADFPDAYGLTGDTASGP